MAWVKLDDQFPHHPKILRAGPLASWLYVASVCYAAEYLTDGFIPEGALHILAAVPNPEALAATLVDVGLWQRAAGGYVIHDYHDYNPSREDVLATREARAEAGSRGGVAKAKQNAGKLPANNQANEQQNPAPSPSPSPSPRPVPSPSPAPTQAGAAAPGAGVREGGNEAPEIDLEAEDGDPGDAMAVIQGHFSDLTGIQPPGARSQRQFDELREKWGDPLRRIGQSCAWNTDSAREVMSRALDRLRAKECQVTCPRSIADTAVAIASQVQRSNDRSRYTRGQYAGRIMH